MPKNRTEAQKRQHVEYMRRWRSRPGNTEKNRTWARQWTINNREANIARSSAHHLKSKYGLTVQEYEQMVADQDGKCAICGIVPKAKLCVDHDHATGEIRELLCHRCNMLAGMIEAKQGVVSKTEAYLAKHASKVGV